MKLEFKHFAYIALAILALYLGYKYLVKGPEVEKKDPNAEGTTTPGTDSGTQPNYARQPINNESVIIRPITGEVVTTDGNDPHIVSHEQETNGGSSNYNSGRVNVTTGRDGSTSGTATRRQ